MISPGAGYPRPSFLVIPAFLSFPRKQESKAITMNQYYVYILSSKKNGTLYVGVTNNLVKRIYTHRNDFIEGFTKKYHVHQLVYYEASSDIYTAITREKQIKKWNRAWKIELIDKNNPGWEDLYNSLL